MKKALSKRGGQGLIGHDTILPEDTVTPREAIKNPFVLELASHHGDTENTERELNEISVPSVSRWCRQGGERMVKVDPHEEER